jgi:GntR family transcriptional regulator/MocR family aminotransferase
MGTSSQKSLSSKQAAMHKQIADGIRAAIVDGRLAPGETLPSIRDLAESLGVSRSTVARSLDDLASQGFIDTIPGIGSQVVPQLPSFLSGQPSELLEKPSPISTESLELSEYGQCLLRNASTITPVSQLNYGGPALELTPIDIWTDLLHRHCRFRDWAKLEYVPEPFGLGPLRASYAAYLSRARGVNCSVDQVAVFSGRELRLDLICRLLIEPGDCVVVENPGYTTARERLQSHGARILPIDVDEYGLKVDQILKLEEPVKLVYVIPSHHEPTGAVLPIHRRQQLLDWAAKSGAFIIEDDYDSEFRYDGRPIPSLQGLDKNDCVIYLTCFWKLLSPVTRLGFLVLPHCLKTSFSLSKKFLEENTPIIEQFVLTDFINEGHLEQHIRRLRTIYAKRREALVEALRTHLGSSVRMSDESAGMDLLIHLESDLSDDEILNAAFEADLPMVSSQWYYVGAGKKGEFIIAFAQLDEEVSLQKIREFAWSLGQRKHLSDS